MPWDELLVAGLAQSWGPSLWRQNGFSRDPMPDEGISGATHQFSNMSLLGGVTLCLGLASVILPARKKNWGFRGSRFPALVSLLTQSHTRRDFAYIRVPGLPLFSTDIILALFLWSLFAEHGDALSWRTQSLVEPTSSGIRGRRGSQRCAWCGCAPRAQAGSLEMQRSSYTRYSHLLGFTSSKPVMGCVRRVFTAPGSWVRYSPS